MIGVECRPSKLPISYVFGDGSVTWTCYSPGARDSGQGSGRKPARDAPRVATFAIAGVLSHASGWSFTPVPRICPLSLRPRSCLTHSNVGGAKLLLRPIPNRFARRRHERERALLRG